MAAELPPRPVLDKDTRHALLETFPGRATVIDRLARLRRCWTDTAQREETELEEFGRLVRAAGGDRAAGAAGAVRGGHARRGGALQDEPEFLAGSTATVCEEFAQAIADLEAPDGARGFTIPEPVGRGATNCCGRGRTTR
ncbi:hypothetical protein [Streptomyces shaanxiensis]